MKSIISPGDFIDIYHKSLLEGPKFFLGKLNLSKTSRIRNSWDKKSSPPIHWWSIPRIQERWNKIISGNSNIEYPDYVVNKYLKNKQNLKLLSPGCGSSYIELKFAKNNCFSRVEWFDLSPSKIDIATENTKRLGYNNSFFFVENVYTYDFGANRYDVILFNSSLHHFNNFKTILEKVHNAMNPGGLLVINEYIGPNRFQWTNQQLKKANYYLNKIPGHYRYLWQSRRIKKKIYRPGLLRMIPSDPSEAVDSEEILPQISRKFKKIEEKPYGGNLLHLIFKDISHNFTKNTSDINKMLDFLFRAEDEFLENTDKSDFLFGVYIKN